MPQPKVIISYFDADGDTSNQTCWALDPDAVPSSFADLMTLINAVTNCGISRVAVQAADAVAVTAVADVPYGVEDKCILQFYDEDGFPAYFVLPGPVASLLESDNETVDPASGTGANSALAALIAEVITVLATKAGKELVRYAKGWRTRNQRAQK